MTITRPSDAAARIRPLWLWRLRFMRTNVRYSRTWKAYIPLIPGSSRRQGSLKRSRMTRCSIWLHSVPECFITVPWNWRENTALNLLCAPACQKLKVPLLRRLLKWRECLFPALPPIKMLPGYPLWALKISPVSRSGCLMPLPRRTSTWT